MTANVPLLRKLVEWVDEQKRLPLRLRQWNQGSWICGTTCCIAGKTVLMTGWQPVTEGQYSKDGVTMSVPWAAQRELGLSVQEAVELFSMHNTSSDIRLIAERIVGERL